MRILLTGASGQLGAYLVDRLVESDHSVVAWSGATRGEIHRVSLEPIDLTDRALIAQRLTAARPDAMIHAAAISSAEVARQDPTRAARVNVEATAAIARWAHLHDCRLVFTSTDLVFDGQNSWNSETDPAHPILTYGRTKLAAESAVLESSRGVVARLALLYGLSRSGRPGFFDRAIGSIREGQPQSFFEDEYRTSLDLASAADILVRLVEGDQTGLIHVAGTERVSRFELMSRAAASLGLDPALVLANRSDEARWAEPRPMDVSLDTSRLASWFPGLRRPSIEEALRLAAS